MRSSPRNNIPAHQEISNVLRGEILAGKYEPKKPLPTEVQLRQRFGTSRFTIRQALETLVVEGLIYRRAGSGTFVTSLPRHTPYVRILGSIEDALALGDETYFYPEVPLRKESSEDAAERLRLKGPEVWVLRGIRFLAEVPFGYWEHYLPPEIGVMLGEGFDSRGYPNVISKIKRDTGARIMRAEQVITAELANDKVAEALEVDVDSPILRIERLYFDEKDDPLELAISRYRPDRYNYRVDLYPRDTH
jgi:DNA-binding GntR family transcriptional regulator